MTGAEPTYANLAEYLTHYSDIVDELDDISILDGLAGEVKVATVKALLLARDPDVLDADDPERFVDFLELLGGVTTEVESIVGTDPQPPVRKLALWAITVGVSAAIERALYPEQQAEGTSGSALQVQYLALLKQLRGTPGAGGPGALGGGLPRGRFPTAEPYPDPARQTTTPNVWWPA